MQKRNAFIRFSELPIFEAIRQGFLYIVPIVVVGATTIAIVNFPVQPFQDFMSRLLGSDWGKIGIIVSNATLRILSIAIVVSMSYSMASRYDKKKYLHPVYFAVGSLACYMIFMPPTLSNVVLTEKQAGSESVFLAILISIFATKLLMLLYNRYDKMLPAREHRFNSSYVVKTALHFLPPLIVCMLLFLVANLLIHNDQVSSFIREASDSFFRALFSIGAYASSALMFFIIQICWFFGIHGGNVFLHFLGGVMNDTSSVNPLFTELPRSYFETFLFSGGSGATLALIPALFIFGKSTERKIAKTALFPALFNINEPLIYGLPLVLNPYYFIPFVLSPVVISITSAFAVQSGLVPLPVNDVFWSTPIFISGYLATESVSGSILQLINFAIAFAIYAPFVRLSAKISEDTYREEFENLTTQLSYMQNGQPTSMLSRNDKLGNLARFLAHEIETSLRKNDGDLYLQYQPKTTYDGKVSGAEALLRWNHPMFGYVSPMTVLTITDEASISAELGRWIITKAFRDMQALDTPGYEHLSLSINLSPLQLESDEDLAEFIRSEATKYDIAFGRLDFELTENAVIMKTEQVDKTLSSIRKLGSDISIDDFGMGHSSLKYLYDFYANVVKLDASLVQAITEDTGRYHIIKSIIDLCKTLDVKVIAEGVETDGQAAALHDMGCRYYQGYYFSKPLTTDEFRQYVKTHGAYDLT